MGIEMMKRAYEILFRVENMLRRYVQDKLLDHYGKNWLIEAPKSMKYLPFRRNPSNYFYHELISLLLAYPCLLFKKADSLFIDLQQTIPIRNKIAHCYEISQEEFDLLENVYFLVAARCKTVNG